ncbi:MAG: ABC-F type ribosomal protection protein [Chloroflexi bacterium]|nr:ABC-F type ribosomal protection protein [Chloroflexota bacterium]
MLQVSNLSKRYGDRLLFQGVGFVLNSGDRVGLVGPNGCGKTTLLRILAGVEQADSGAVSYAVPRTRVGYLPQALTYGDGATVRDALSSSREHDQEYWGRRLQQVAARMATAQGAELATLTDGYAEALERLNRAAALLPEHRVAAILRGLGLEDAELSTPVEILSGGQKTRLGLARLLLQSPALLLLDEPTNHLDITALEWLESYLREYDGAMLIVSHDRTFLDRIVQAIYEINPETHALGIYPGNYSAYVSAKEREQEKHWQQYQDQQDEIARMKSEVRRLSGHAGRIERETIHYHYRKIAKKIARQAVVRQRRLQRLLDSEDLLDKPRQRWQMKLAFEGTPSSGQDVLVLEGLGKRFGDLRLFQEADLILRRGERVALIGPNGSGKTTLLRIIVGQELPSEGAVKIGANVQIGYLSQEQDNLDWESSPFETAQRAMALNETEARQFLHNFLFAGDDVFTPVGSLSYGERARLALGVLVLQGCNLLLLDEPINHLDIPSRERFEQALSTYEGTVLAVVHDRYFVSRFATAIWALEAGRIKRYVDLEDARRGCAAAEHAGTDALADAS